MAAASQPREAGDAEDAIPLTQPMFDGDVTDNDPPAPRLVVTDDAEMGATVPSHKLPVPEVGDAIVVLGRATLARQGGPTRPQRSSQPRAPRGAP